jgi:hypothetical protein
MQRVRVLLSRHRLSTSVHTRHTTHDTQ